MDQQLVDLEVLGGRHACAIRLAKGGTRVGDAVYLNEALLSQQPAPGRELVTDAAQLAVLPDTAFNVVRISIRRPEVAFLYYPNFFVDPFPALRSS